MIIIHGCGHALILLSITLLFYWLCLTQFGTKSFLKLISLFFCKVENILKGSLDSFHDLHFHWKFKLFQVFKSLWQCPATEGEGNWIESRLHFKILSIFSDLFYFMHHLWTDSRNIETIKNRVKNSFYCFLFFSKSYRV